MPRVHTVKKARKNYPDYDIKKGDTYYWWKFRYGGKVKSKTYPKRAQLTRSGFKQTIYGIEDRIAEISADDPSDLESDIEDIKGELESLKEECESSLENMPENLQESSESGMMLQERIDGLDEAIGELENFEFDFDETEAREEIVEELKEEKASELGKDTDDITEKDLDEDDITERLQNKKDEKVQEIVDELGNICLPE